MTLKNSFLASLKENNKRRIWLWIVSLFTFVLILPSLIMMIISQHTNRYDYFFESYGEVLAEEMMKNSLIQEMNQILNVGQGGELWLIVAAFAVLSAVQGFSYLYNRKKIDFYMGMPIKRKSRFLIIWLNGVLVYAIPCLLGLFISLLIVAANGALTGEVLLGACQSYGLFFCLYLGVYHLAILAVMLTGNIIITGFAVGVLFLYECIIRVIVMSFMESFYRFYSYRGYTTMPMWSPFSILFNYQDAYSSQKENIWLTIFHFLLFAAVAGVIPYLCYLKRPAEATGKAIAFSKPKPVLKVMIAVPVALLAGIFAAEMVQYEPLYGRNNGGVVFFVIAVTLIFTCCLMQVIYEFDIKGIMHKKRHILISAIFVVIIYVIFRYDLFGYDSYIPDVNKVESAAIATPVDNYLYYGNEYWDEELNYMTKEAYVEDNMYLTDIGAVNQLMKRSMELSEGYENLDLLYDDEQRQWRRVTITYRMANKRKICREILIDLEDKETLSLLDRLESSEEYIAGGIFGASEIPMNALGNMNKHVNAYYGNGTYRVKMKREDAKELLALYQEDVLKGGFMKYRENAPVGALCLELEEKQSYYTSYNQTEMLIYPFYEECIAYLKENGYYMEELIRLEDVDKIQIVNYHYDLLLDAQSQDGATTLTEAAVLETYIEKYEPEEAYKCTVTYEEPEKIAKILDKLYSRSYIYSTWHNEKHSDENYSVKVYFKQDSNAEAMDNEGFDYFNFAEGEVPSFVAEDTAY